MPRTKQAVVLPEEPKQIGFRTNYNNVYVEKGITFELPTLTDESFRAESDIYFLLQNAGANTRTPLYGEQDDMTFEDWSNEVAMVKRRYMHLDPEQRARFGNAQNFLAFCADPQNYMKQNNNGVEEEGV